MSYTTKVKNEIAKLDGERSTTIAFLSGFFRNNVKIFSDHIELLTENNTIARRIYQSLKELYGISPEIVLKKNAVLKKNTIYQINITDKVDLLLEDLSVMKNGVALEIPSEFIVGDTEEIRAYLMGVFLAAGSVNDPKTSQYHLEILIDYPRESVFVQKLMNEFDLNAKLLTRDKGYMVYLKEAEKISDFLRLLKANQAVLYFEDVRIFRENKNRTNRLNNCEQANMDKTIQSSYEQLQEIQMIEEKIGIDLLSDKLKEACEYRKKYPEVSLKELSEIMSLETGKTITKSGLNHRFRKLKEIVSNFK